MPRRIRNRRLFSCPTCCGPRLMYVVTVARPASGVIVRYRKCEDCRGRVRTEERIVTGRPFRKAAVRPRKKPATA